ncbi:hypothetical protein LCGC14_1155370 [marine sediment metagenome]|uniref:Uncharacterized protein n=1 Tax=marine sediment metagenome TaxID=412755 RepID=A0A0F9MHD4_9ZZZZ
MSSNPLTTKEKEAATARHKDSLNIGEVWGHLTTEQKREVLEYVLFKLDRVNKRSGVRIERAINGDQQIWLNKSWPMWINYRNDLISEILSRGDPGPFAACINGVPGFEDATRDIMAELVSEGQVVDEGGERYGG